jgi:hypothetical protein
MRYHGNRTVSTDGHQSISALTGWQVNFRTTRAQKNSTLDRRYPA